MKNIILFFIVSLFSFCSCIIYFIFQAYYNNIFYLLYSIMFSILGTCTLGFGIYFSLNNKLDKIIKRLDK